MTDGPWKVGELAERTGVSIRTLHYYDEIGLVSPSGRTASSHRLYTAEDVARLQQVVSLKQIGLALEQIAAVLRGPSCSPRRVIELHLERLREQIGRQQGLCARLAAIARRLGSNETVAVEDFMQAIKETEMIERFEKHYTPEQLRELEARWNKVGPDRILAVEQEWKTLIAEVRAKMDEGVDPGSESVKAMARRWQGLIDEFTGGNAGIEASLRQMYRKDPNIAAGRGYTPDPHMMDYIGRAISD